MDNPDSRRDVESLFNEELLPKIKALQDNRQQSTTKRSGNQAKAIVVFSVFNVLVWAICSYLGISIEATLLAIGISAFCSGFGCWLYINQPTEQYLHSYRTLIMEAACKRYDKLAYNRYVKKEKAKEFRKKKVVPRFSSSKIEDVITGTTDTCAFKVMEAKLYHEPLWRYFIKHPHVVDGKILTFHGILVHTAVQTNISCEIFVTNRPDNLMKRIKYRNNPKPRLDLLHKNSADWKVFSDDADQASSLVSEQFMDRIQHMSSIIPNQHFSLLLQANTAYVALYASQPFMEWFNNETPVERYKQTFEQVVGELGAIVNLIDSVQDLFSQQT